MKKVLRYFLVVLFVFSIGFIFDNLVKESIAENKPIEKNENIENIGTDIANLAIDATNPGKINSDDLSKLDQRAKSINLDINKLDKQDKKKLENSKKVLNHVTKTINMRMLDPSEALAKAEKSGKENSYRFIDGVDMSVALNTITKETGAKSSNSNSLKTYVANGQNIAKISAESDVINLSNSSSIDGIDVSYHNGKINWDKVKASGIKFAILRCGYGKDITSQDDKRWNEYVTECEKHNIPYGVYLYSYAHNFEDVDSEVAHTLRLVRGHNPTFPIYYDLEENSQEALGEQTLSAFAFHFCNQIAQAGYKTGVYANLNWYRNYLTTFEQDGRYSHWIARYNSNDGHADPEGPFKGTTFNTNVDMWQYTSRGYVDGIGTYVDLNYSYVDAIDWSKNVTARTTGLVQAKNDTWYYVQNGFVNWNFSGLVLFNGNWYYVNNGVIDWNYSNIVEYNGSWYYVHNGMIDWSINTLARVNGQGPWYQITNGTLNWKYSGLSFYNGVWYYVNKGKVDWSFNGLVEYNGNWYYVHNGIIDWSYNKLIWYNGSWYYVHDGMIHWDYSNLVDYNNNWYYVHNGMIDWKYNTLAQVDGKGLWYQVTNGMINWNYTNLSFYNGTWYYINHGILDWQYNNLVQYNGYWYYVRNGAIDWTYQTLSRVNNQGAWYQVVNGMIDWNYNGLSEYNGILYYVHNGYVNWNYSGQVKYKGSYYTVTNGMTMPH